MRKLSRITALVMAFILFVTVSPMWSLNVNATEVNNPDEQTQQIQQQESAQGQDVNEGQDQGDDQQQGQVDDQQQAQNDEGQEQQAGESQEQAAGQESGNEQSAQNVQEQAPSQENPDEQIQQDQQAQQHEPAAGEEGGEQGEEEPLEIPQINNMQNMVLMSAPAMLGAAADPGEGEGDEPEEGEVDEQKIAFAIDGWEDMSFTFEFSCNGLAYLPLYSYDGNEWIDPMENENPNAPIPLENGYIEFVQNPIDPVPDNKQISVDFNLYDNRMSDGGAHRIIAYAIADPWFDNPIDLMGVDNCFIHNEYPDSCQFVYYYTNIAELDGYHPINLGLGYPDAGDPAILEESESRLYAYNSETADDAKYLLAADLYGRYISVAMFESFGLPVFDYNNDEDREHFSEGVYELDGRIDLVGDETIDVILADGSVQQRHVWDYKVNWGNSMFDGSPVEGNYQVVQLTNPEEIIVRSSFDGPYYSRTAFTDDVQFTADEENPQYALVIMDAKLGEGAAIAGNGTNEDQISGNDGIITAQVYTQNFMEQFTEPYGTTIRFLNSGDTYVAVTGSGEGKAYGQLGVNGYAIDSVFATGENLDARVYIGESEIYIEPLTVGGLANTTIKSVTLKDDSQRDGVIIDTSDLNKIKLTFKSNFYDSVPLSITYSTGETRDLTINRIGLLLQYRYLKDNGGSYEDNGIETDELWTDFRDGSCSVDYNYNQGQQIVVYATYYHPTNDLTASGGDDLYLNVLYDNGQREIIPHTGYVAETDNEVAVSWFVIGYAPAKVFDGVEWTDNITEQTYVNKYGNAGGFSMTVLNAGFNDDTSFGGTQVGSGKGVYWDGKITWF